MQKSSSTKKFVAYTAAASVALFGGALLRADQTKVGPVLAMARTETVSVRDKAVSDAAITNIVKGYMAEHKIDADIVMVMDSTFKSQHVTAVVLDLNKGRTLPDGKRPDLNLRSLYISRSGEIIAVRSTQ